MTMLIVGAGAAGLATARQLQILGINAQIIDAHQAGSTWTQHYDRLHLHTLKGVSCLPGRPMPESVPDLPSGRQYAEYLQDYARHFEIPVEEDVRVIRTELQHDGWRVETNAGVRRASHLIAATGIWSSPVEGAFPGLKEFSGQVLHSGMYLRPDQIPGERVLVVGVGNSGSEIALDLADAGKTVSIAVRTGALFVPPPTSVKASEFVAAVLRSVPALLANRILGQLRRDFADLGLPLPPGDPLDSYPVVGYGLPEAVAGGHISVVGAFQGIETSPGGDAIARCLPHAQAPANASNVDVPIDALVLATGYRPALDWLDPATVQFLPDGRVDVDEFSRSRASKYLSCVGYDYPTTEGWLQAIGRVAIKAAHRIADESIADERIADGR